MEAQQWEFDLAGSLSLGDALRKRRDGSGQSRQRAKLSLYRSALCEQTFCSSWPLAGN